MGKTSDEYKVKYLDEQLPKGELQQWNEPNLQPEKATTKRSSCRMNVIKESQVTYHIGILLAAYKGREVIVRIGLSVEFAVSSRIVVSEEEASRVGLIESDIVKA